MPPKQDESVSLKISAPAEIVRIRKDSAALHTRNADPTTRDSKRQQSSAGPPEASLAARYACASIVMGIFAVWGKLSFVTEGVPGGTIALHSWKVPVVMNVFYLASLPLLRLFTDGYLSKAVDVRSLLKESMLVYNVGQVLLNGWMCYAFIDALLFRGHPFVFGHPDLVGTGATYAVWIHYCDKYLEYLDTYFMVLRGRMDQVSFLHVYHHTSISLAWWVGLRVHPGGDAYFGALFNSFIHVLMYSYYAMALLKIPCPWKRYLTQAQLMQFTLVVVYTAYANFFCRPENKSWRVTVVHYTQAFEMISLFVLFMAFYRKTYSSTKKNVIATPTNAHALAKIEVPSKKEDSSVEDTEQASVSSDSSLEEHSSNTSNKKNL